MNIKETKKSIIQAGQIAVNELIKVAEEKIITNTEDDISADRLKNAAATKKLAIFDAFEILYRIQEEEKYSIYIRKDKAVIPWKDFNKNMAISVEYNLEY